MPQETTYSGQGARVTMAADTDTDTKDDSGLTGNALAIYKKLCAKGVKPALAKAMATRAASKMGSTDTSRWAPVGTVELAAVPDNLRQDARDEAAKKGQALPGGRFPIRNLEEVGKAIQAFSLAKGDKSGIKAFILKRAKALGAGQDVIDKINALNDGDGDESGSDSDSDD
jgi:hypothetical protein